MSYLVNPAVWSRVFPIPSDITDRHIKMCSGVALKCLLLMLRSPEEYGSVQALAAKLGQQPVEIADALNYWEEQGILVRCEEGSAPVFAAPAAESHAAVPNAAVPVSFAPQTAAAITPAAPSRPRFPRDEALSLINDDETLRSLMSELQAVLGKPLTSADADVLVALYSFYHLSAHYIISLVHYCVTIGKHNMSYVERVAVSWINEGVDDSTLDAHIDRLYRRHSNEGRVRSIFGITGRSLTSREKKYIAAWFDDMGFDTDLIELAYEITVDRKGQLIFSYINSILSDWHKKGVKTPAQAKQESAPEKAPSTEGKKQQGASELDIKLINQLMNT